MKNARENEILDILQNKQYIDVNTLAEKIFVSTSTIRRILNNLQQKGLVIRTHGGVKLNDENNYAPNFTFRVHENSYEKKKIALSAIKLIKNGDLIFLDGTTSSFFIAEYLSDFKNIKVITNGIDTLSLLAKYNISAYSTGGYIQKENTSVLVGTYAEHMINSFHADIAFFSARSIDCNGEIYDCFEDENVVRKAMLNHASKKVFLCDSTKFDRTSPYHLCSINDIDCIITNNPITKNINIDKKIQIIIP